MTQNKSEWARGQETLMYFSEKGDFNMSLNAFVEPGVLCRNFSAWKMYGHKMPVIAEKSF